MEKRLIFLPALFVFLFVLIVPPSMSAVGFSWQCEKAYENTEFYCNISLDEGYDLKFDLFDNGKRVSKIWENGWKSTNYYIINFFDDKIKLIINSSENVSGVIKLRKTSTAKIEYTENISLSVGPKESEEQVSPDNKTSDENADESEKENKTAEDSELAPSKKVISPNIASEVDNVGQSENIINLNPDLGKEQEKVIYESKSEKIRKYAVYGFCIFLIFIIIILLLKK